MSTIRPWYSTSEARAVLRGCVAEIPQTVRQVATYARSQDEACRYDREYARVIRLDTISKLHLMRYLAVADQMTDRSRAGEIMREAGAHVSVDMAIDAVRDDDCRVTDQGKLPVIDLRLGRAMAA